MRCPHCTTPDGLICRSVAHPHYCILAARSDDRGAYYREFLRNGGISPGDPAVPDRRIRVGFHTPSFYRGGAERWVLDLARTLDGMRFRIVGFSCTDPSIGPDDMKAEAEATAPIFLGRDGLRALDARCDVLIVWGDHDVPGLIGTPRSKIVIVSHTSGEWGEAAVSGWDRAAGLVAVSEVAVTPFPPEARGRVIVIPNGFQEARVRPLESRESVRASWGVKTCESVLGVLGRIAPEKGPIHLIHAVHLLPSHWVGVHVGQGLPPFSDHVKLVAGAFYPPRVIHPGYRPDVGSVLHAFDSFLLASDYEGSSLALLEAWAAGVPAITTPVGIAMSHPELVRTVPLPVDPFKIAQAVMHDEADPLGTGRRARRARDVAEERYSGRRWSERWGDYLSDLMSTRKSSSGRTTMHLTGIPFGGVRGDVTDPEFARISAEAKDCRHRGCRTSCREFDCERFGVTVTNRVCVECALALGIQR